MVNGSSTLAVTRKQICDRGVDHSGAALENAFPARIEPAFARRAVRLDQSMNVLIDRRSDSISK